MNASTFTPKITDEAIEALRKEIGTEAPIPQFNSVASTDAIRHYALGIGDDNPRWIDRDYSASTRWSGITAPPTFVMSCGFPRSRGLPGVHGLFSGVDLHCHAPIREGMSVTAGTALHDLVEKEGRYAGRQFQQIYVTRYRDSDGQVLSTLYTHAFRVDRKEGGSRGKYKEIGRQHYTQQEIDEFAATYEREKTQRRGNSPRYFEDVAEGEELSPILKGPLTVTDCICFLMGFGYIYVRGHRQWYEFMRRHPGAAVKDRYGVPDVPERVHWEEDLAHDIGMPTAYDYGPQRIAWFDHCLHDWMGDDGWLRRLQVRLTAPNFIGDATWIKGRIVSRDAADNSISIDLQAVDQRGRVTATGSAEVVLPGRNHVQREDGGVN